MPPDGARAGSGGRRVRGKGDVFKVNVDNSPDIAMRFGVQGIPNLTFLRDGQVVDQAVGAMPASQIRARIQQNL